MNKASSPLSLTGLAGHSMASLILLILLVGGGYHSWLVCMDQREDCRRKEAELHAIEQQIREVEAGNAMLGRRRDRLRTEAGVEEIAREKLGMVRKGEIAFVVEPGPPAAAPAEPILPPAAPPPEPGLVRRLLDRFLF